MILTPTQQRFLNTNCQCWGYGKDGLDEDFSDADLVNLEQLGPDEHVAGTPNNADVNTDDFNIDSDLTNWEEFERGHFHANVNGSISIKF